MGLRPGSKMSHSRPRPCSNNQRSLTPYTLLAITLFLVLFAQQAPCQDVTQAPTGIPPEGSWVIEVDSLKDAQLKLQQCAPNCIFQFTVKECTIGPRDALIMSQGNVTLLGALTTGTTLTCAPNAPRVVVNISRGAVSPAEGALSPWLRLLNLHFTSCWSPQHIVFAKQATVELHNVTFTSNQPRNALLHLQLLPGADPQLVLNNTNFSHNVLPAGGMLLRIENLGFQLPWKARDPDLVAAVYEAAVRANLSSYAVSFEPERLLQLLDSRLLTEVMISARDSWWAIERELQSYLNALLVQVVIQETVVQNNTGTGGMELMSLRAVNVVVEGLQLLDNRVMGQESNAASGQIIGVYDGGAAVRGLVAARNGAVGILYFNHSLGSVSFEDCHFEENEVESLSLVDMSAGSVIMDDLLVQLNTNILMLGGKVPVADQRAAEKLRRALHLVDGMWFTTDEYGQARGYLDGDSLNRMIAAGVAASEQEVWDVAENMGLGQWYNPRTTMAGTFTAHFMQLLEMATLRSNLMFERPSPVTFTNVTFISNRGSSYLLRLTGSSLTASSHLQMQGVIMTNNTFLSTVSYSQQSDPSHPILNGAIIFMEYVQGEISNITFSSNNVTTAVILNSVVLGLKNASFQENMCTVGLLVASQNMTGEGAEIYQNYLKVEKLSVRGNVGMGPLFWMRNSSVMFDSMTLEGNKANMAPQAQWPAYQFYSGYSKSDAEMPPTMYTCTGCKVYQVDNTLMRNNYAATALLNLNDSVYNTIDHLDCQYNQATCLCINAGWNRDLNLDGVVNDVMNITRSVFSNNVATSGQAAGVALRNVEWVRIGVLDSTFHNNQIPESMGPLGRGAALSCIPDWLWTTKRGGYIYAENITFTNNQALHGGAVYLNQSAMTSVGLAFINNSARGMGGGMFCHNAMFDVMTSTLFENNQASSGGGLMLSTRMVGWLTPTGTRFMKILNNHFKRNMAWGSLWEPYDLSWELCPSGGGGGVCMAFVDDVDWDLVRIADNVFENNTATLGGAMLLNNNVFSQNKAVCRVALINNTMVNNKVINGSGPVLFFNVTSGVCMGCPAPSLGELRNATQGAGDKLPLLGPAPAASLPSCPQGPSWQGNIKVGEESYGEGDYASYPQDMEITFCDEEGHAVVDSHSTQTFLRLKSGANFNARVKLLDVYGNVVPRVLNNITLVLQEAPGLLAYNYTPVMPNQTNSFMQGISVQALQVPDGSQFPISFLPLSSQGPLPAKKLALEIRSCYIGEFISDRWTCVQCGRGSFSQHPNIRCLPCPMGGNCNASGVMVPRKGFWQSSPYSPVIYRCLLYRSCYSQTESPSRSDSLRSLLYHKTFPMSQQDVDAFMAAQCNKGYQGRLCGTCQKGYGRVNTRCVHCLANPRGNTLILLLAIALVCCIIALLVYTHIKGLAQGRQAWATPGEVDPTKEDHAGRIGGLVKVLVSYIQVLAITRSVPLDWPTSFIRLLELVDLTSSPSWVSLDCSAPNGSPQSKAIMRVVIAALTPAFLSVVAVAMWSLWSMVWRRQKKKMAWGSLCTLTIIQICYLLYPFSAGAAFSAFGCFQLNPQYQDKNSIQLYKEQGLKARQQFVEDGHYWLQNFEHECYKGSHAALAYAFGIPWTLLFTIGFPAMSAWLLYRNREDLGASDVMMKYGFLYEEYTLRYYAWESVIMSRKAAMLAVVAFMHHLGSVLQLSTALLVIIVAALAHDIGQPFRETLLNNMERLSLFATLLHLASLLLIARQSPSALRWVTFSVVIVVNAGLVLYNVYCICVEVYLWMVQDGERFKELFERLKGSVRKLMAGWGTRMGTSFERVKLTLRLLPQRYQQYMRA